jgi:hypothetical protein
MNEQERLRTLPKTSFHITNLAGRTVLKNRKGGEFFMWKG